MCEIYSGVEDELFELKTRSIRLDGVVTSIRLEGVFWQVLEAIAQEDNLTIGLFLTRIYNEVIARSGEVKNFTSILRVACTTYLNQGKRITPLPTRYCESDIMTP
ncbi:ribbon-helix-helix domain-containing protein [Vibrio tapetis subsp. quintayensis]|uniref:ribbon-helix-helix domain-containing protein n=1 Tax=Vibrio tapetis TaxID=52443 RepID=UPI0025B5795D|nr:ribbon-helix-helix domain-containing protein [Vibrio tapetis]MDN3681107.1 ribbon-helix-helix domain-containing protein [Vibrio tapetis subsp. quintayensis]